jgi:hypothetical protein
MTSLSSKKPSAASLSSWDRTLRQKAVLVAGSMAARGLPVVPRAVCRAMKSARLGCAIRAHGRDLPGERHKKRQALAITQGLAAVPSCVQPIREE